MLVGSGMLQFILKFLQAVFGETQEQPDALVGVLRVADLVRFHGREVVLLPATARGERHRREHRHRQNHINAQAHGHISGEVGGTAAVGFSGGLLGAEPLDFFSSGFTPSVRRGKSNCSSSSSMDARSLRTNSSGGRYSEGAMTNISSSSRIAL